MSNSLEAKIVVLGSQGVGKTSLVNRYVKNAFSPPLTTSTVGASFLTKRVLDVDTSTVVRLQIWDTAGQERFRSISKLYYRGANAALLCYDITDAQSFLEMGRWLTELKQNIGSDIIIHIVGTKSDIVAEEPTSRKVPFERCIAYAAEQLFPERVHTVGSIGDGENHKEIRGFGGAKNSGSTGSSISPVAVLGNTGSPSNGVIGNRGITSPESNRSSGFWGYDIGWDCCHEISAKDGEGVEEVFRVITRKLVEQRNQALERDLGLVAQAASEDGDYFNQRSGDGNGSFRVGVGDKRRSWLGFPATPGIGGGSNVNYPEVTDLEATRRKQDGKCC